MSVTTLQQEAVRNRLLRRVDWRFLLPSPQPGHTLCLANGVLAEAIATIAGRESQGDGEQPGAHDLVVATNPDQATLQAAWAALRPGGVCYTEWHRPLVGGPQGVRRRLESAGFAEVTSYWPWPWPTHGNALFWLPLEAPGALHYVLANRVPLQSVVKRLVRALYQVVWQVGLRLRFVFPICAIAYKPGPAIADQDAIGDEALLNWIRTHWCDWGLGERPTDLAWILLTGGAQSINKVVGLLFADEEHAPRLVVKWPRVPESIPALEREVKTLRALQTLQPAGIPGVPRLLFCQGSGDSLAVGETALTGVPLWARLRRDNFRSFALQATDWQAKLAYQRAPQPRQVWWDRLVAPVLADFERHFAAVLEPQRLQKTRAVLATLDNLPLVCEQRDFSPWNLLVDANGELVVLDWESAELAGLPALDLLYFLAYLAIFLEGTMGTPRAVESYRTTLDAQTFTGGIVAECLTRYVEQTGLDPQLLRPLRLLLWLIHSRSEYDRFVREVGGEPPISLLRSSFFLRFWEEELDHLARHDAPLPHVAACAMS
jgi:hypothetical protein